MYHLHHISCTCCNAEHRSFQSITDGIKPIVEQRIDITANKPSKDCKLGFRLKREWKGDGSFIRRIDWINPRGLFASTDLSVGMILEAVNGTQCSTPKQYEDVMNMLQQYKGKVILTCIGKNDYEDYVPPKKAEKKKSCGKRKRR